MAGSCMMVTTQCTHPTARSWLCNGCQQPGNEGRHKGGCSATRRQSGVLMILPPHGGPLRKGSTKALDHGLWGRTPIISIQNGLSAVGCEPMRLSTHPFPHHFLVRDRLASNPCFLLAPLLSLRGRGSSLTENRFRPCDRDFELHFEDSRLTGARCSLLRAPGLIGSRGSVIHDIPSVCVGRWHPFISSPSATSQAEAWHRAPFCSARPVHSVARSGTQLAETSGK
jgi:hypothetical protein